MESADSSAPFGDMLRRFRKAAGLTQEELAERAHLSRNAVNALERGARLSPRRDTVTLLANALALSDDNQSILLTAAHRRRPSMVGQLAAAHASFPDAGNLPVPAQAETGARSTHLPVPPTPLIGREREVEQATALLHRRDVRLLTLTGPGGVGKTRLALAVANACSDLFADGTVFASLASLGEPGLLAEAIAHAVGAPGDQHPEEAIIFHVRERHLLLVLDGIEHLLATAPLLATLLAACPHLSLLVTSRITLRLRSEHVLPVPPLRLADADAPLPVLAATPAIVLFVTRAQSMLPEFALTAENAAAVAAICRRLDGLPLALELAAARLRLLSPQALLARLEQRLPTLVDGARDLPERQRTLRATLRWSFDLLPFDAQGIFRRFSVFAGGATPEAVVAVCAPDRQSASSDVDALEGLAALVDHSLLRQVEPATGMGERRFRMLETIREFADELLAASGERTATQQAHASYQTSLVELAEPALYGPNQASWMERLDAEVNNFRAALRWTCDAEERELGLRIAGSLWYFWFSRGYLREGRTWYDRLLTTADGATERAPVAPAVLAKALGGAAWLAYVQTDYDQAILRADESLALARALGEETLCVIALSSLGCVALDRADYDHAMPLLEESLTRARAAADSWGMAVALINLGLLTGLRGDYGRARELLEESLALGRARGDVHNIAYALDNLGTFAVAQGDYGRARELLEESLPLHRNIGDIAGAAEGIEDMARIAAALDAPSHAAQLLGAAESLRNASGAVRPLYLRTPVEGTITDVCGALGRETFETMWAEGGALSFEQAIAAALTSC
jgi:predicted ATPase/transcriptional regulator with XRE-family HTH domain